MSEQWMEPKNKYEKMEIPEELNSIILKEIEKDKQKQKKYRIKKIAAIVASCAAMFVMSVNLNATIAYAMYQIPVLGDLAKIVTFREYQYSDPLTQMDITIPKIENTNNKELENKINEEINQKMQQVIDDAKLDAQQRKQIAQEKGISQDDIYQAGVFADYEVKYSDEKILSFVITVLQTAADSNTQGYYYTIDLTTGKQLHLHDMLGENYKQLADKSILKQIKQRMESDESQVFFGFSQEDKELGIEGFTGISEQQPFYINEKGNVVIAFPRFEIAPGYMGIPEFEIVKEE